MGESFWNFFDLGIFRVGLDILCVALIRRAVTLDRVAVGVGFCGEELTRNT